MAGDGRALPVEDDAIPLDGIGPGGCMRYDVDAVDASESSRFASRVDGALLLDQTSWLWEPRPRPEEFRSTVRFDLPPPLEAAVPWPRLDPDHYQLVGSVFEQTATCAFGSMELDEVEIPGAVLDVAILGGMGPLDVEPATLRRWLAEAGSAVATILGRFPVTRATVVVVPVPGRDEPVAFGLARRGGGASVMLLLSRGAEEEALVGEWVAVHEFSHFALPLLHRRDAWMTEGLATYYQEVVRARRGLLTPVAAFENILAGFGRGRRAGTGRTLREESADMGRTFAFHRVYWAGTAYALEVDVTLRRESDGRMSLDRAIELASPTWGENPRMYSAEEMTAILDRASGTDVFTRVAARSLELTEFPDVEPLLARLGVASAAGSVRFVDAPDAAVRDAILSDARR